MVAFRCHAPRMARTRDHAWAARYSSVASRMHAAITCIAVRTSPTGGRVGAIRMFRLPGSRPPG